MCSDVIDERLIGHTSEPSPPVKRRSAWHRFSATLKNALQREHHAEGRAAEGAAHWNDGIRCQEHLLPELPRHPGLQAELPTRAGAWRLVDAQCLRDQVASQRESESDAVTISAASGLSRSPQGTCHSPSNAAKSSTHSVRCGSPYPG